MGGKIDMQDPISQEGYAVGQFHSRWGRAQALFLVLLYQMLDQRTHQL